MRTTNSTSRLLSVNGSRHPRNCVWRVTSIATVTRNATVLWLWSRINLNWRSVLNWSSIAGLAYSRHYFSQFASNVLMGSTRLQTVEFASAAKILTLQLVASIIMTSGSSKYLDSIVPLSVCSPAIRWFSRPNFPLPPNAKWVTPSFRPIGFVSKNHTVCLKVQAFITALKNI